MTARDELARQMYINDNWGIAQPERLWDELFAHPVEFERYRARADALIAAGWRKMPSRDSIIREMAEIDEQQMIDESWATIEYMYGGHADAILTLMDGDNE